MVSNTSDKDRNVTVAARSQMRVPLGRFASDYRLKGFSVKVKPESLQKEDVTTEVMRIEDSTGYRMYMNIVNYSDKTIHAVICEV